MIELRPDMRTWIIPSKNCRTFLDKLQAKGITSMDHFKLNLILKPFEINACLNKWRNHVYKLSVFPQDNNDGKYHFQNLESVFIMVRFTCTRNGEILRDMLNTHRATLKRLEVFCYDNFKVGVYILHFSIHF